MKKGKGNGPHATYSLGVTTRSWPESARRSAKSSHRSYLHPHRLRRCAVLISWKLALIAYAGAGIYLAVQRNRANDAYDRRGSSDFERMENVDTSAPPSTRCGRNWTTTDRRLMAIDDHLNNQ